MTMIGTLILVGAAVAAGVWVYRRRSHDDADAVSETVMRVWSAASVAAVCLGALFVWNDPCRADVASALFVAAPVSALAAWLLMAGDDRYTDRMQQRAMWTSVACIMISLFVTLHFVFDGFSAGSCP